MNLSKAQFLKAFLLFSLGALTSFSFAPYTQYWTIFLAFPILFRFLSVSYSKKIGFFYGWSFGFGQFSFGLYWITNALKLDSVDLAYLAPFSAVLFPMALALFTGFVCAFYVFLFRKYIRSISLNAAFLFAFVFYIGEFLRGFLFSGFPWNLQGYAFWSSDILMQATSLFGIYGLSFLSVFLASLLGVIWKNAVKLRLQASLLFIAVVSSLFIYGWQRLEKNPIEHLEFDTYAKLRLVQGNINQSIKWEKAKAHSNLKTYIDLTKSKDWQNITHIVWPETALPFILNLNLELAKDLGKIVPKEGGLLLGSTRYITKPFEKMWNSLYVLDEFGHILDFYDKKHLVPFGEYFPFKSILKFSKISYGDIDFSEGEKPNVINIKSLLPFAALICYEVIFPEEVRKNAKGAEFLLNITNDAWYGNSAGPQQHLHIARIRAIENGLPLLRNANTGVSAIIDPFGRILNKLDYGISGIIDTNLPKSLPEKTPYSKLGDWFFVIFLFFIAIISLLYRTRQKF